MVHVFLVDPENCAPDYYYKLKDRLSRIPDLTYYVFTTGVAGDETELARTVENIFEGEQLRIYSCGNVTTARNILDGIHDLSRIEFAIVSQGMNEYLIPAGGEQKFDAIEELINGRVVHTDYIKTNHGLALNSVAFGFDAYLTKTHDSIASLKVFGRTLPWVLATIHTLFASPNQIFTIDTDDKSMVRKTTSLYLGNVPLVVRTIAYSDDFDIRDGLATFSFLHRRTAFSRLLYYFKKIRGIPMNESDDRYNYTCQTGMLKVRDINIRPVLCSLDGKLVTATDWKMEVVKQGLRFVVPREAAL